METGKNSVYSGPRKGSPRGDAGYRTSRLRRTQLDTLGKRLRGKTYIVCRGLRMVDIKTEDLILMGRRSLKVVEGI